MGAPRDFLGCAFLPRVGVRVFAAVFLGEIVTASLCGGSFARKFLRRTLRRLPSGGRLCYTVRYERENFPVTIPACPGRVLVHEPAQRAAPRGVGQAAARRLCPRGRKMQHLRRAGAAGSARGVEL